MTLTPPTPDGMTELVNASIDRVDLVGSAANGTRFLIAKGAGLVPADTVRDLIEKADTTTTEVVVVSWDAVDEAAALVKAGRALSAANEKALRDAAAKIQNVLNALPQPDSENLLKETTAMAEENTTPPAEAEDITKTADAEAIAAGLEAVAKAGEAGADGIDVLREAAAEAPAEVVKADKPKKDKKAKKLAKAASMTLVYDKSGNAIGVIDPSSLTAVDGGGAPDAAPLQQAAADDPDAPAPADKLAQASAAGDDAGDPSRTIPGTSTIQAPVQKDGKKKKNKADKPAKTDKVKKGAPAEESAPTDIAAVLKELLTPFAEEIRKTQDLAGAVQALEERITKFGKQPDDRNSAYLNGATGTPGVAPRDGAEADPYVDLRKAAAEARTQSDVIKSSKDLAFAQIKDAISGNGSQHFEAVTDRFTSL